MKDTKTINIDNATADMLMQLLQGVKTNNSSIERIDKTLDELIEEWLLMKKGTVEDTTLSTYSLSCRGLSKVFGDWQLSAISRQDIKKWLDNSLQVLKYNTVKHRFFTLKDLFKYAVECEYIDNNTCKGIKMPKTRDKTYKEPATIEQYEALLQVAKDCPYWIILPLLYYTGCRIGEAVALTWDDVDFDNRTIRVNKQYTYMPHTNKPIMKYYTKTKAGMRTVVIHKDLLSILKARYAEYGAKNNHVIYQIKKNNTMPVRQMQYYLQRWCDKANIYDVTLHSFRHSATSNFLEMGVAPNLVASMLGHKDIMTTLNIYSRKTMKDVDFKNVLTTIDQSPIVIKNS